MLSGKITFLPYHHIFKRFYLFIFREKGREGEREEGKHQCVVASHAPPTGDLAHNPGMGPDWELNQGPFGLQAHAQSTEVHKPGLSYFFIVFFYCLGCTKQLTETKQNYWPCV